MSAQHPNVKILREFRRVAEFAMSPMHVEAIDWAIRVCEAADRLVNNKGRAPEKNYGRLETAVGE